MSTNDKICTALGAIGAGQTFISAGLFFFGVAPAWIFAALGLALCVISERNYDNR